MGLSLRQANLFMCKVWAISRGRRAAGYWNNIQGPEVRLPAQKLPARLAGTLCYYFASNFFALKRDPHSSTPNFQKAKVLLYIQKKVGTSYINIPPFT